MFIFCDFLKRRRPKAELEVESEFGAELEVELDLEFELEGRAPRDIEIEPDI